MKDFNEQKAKLLNEVNRFEDSGNDLIFIAKEMARMMQDMVAFTKGKGPLKNNTDVINIATQISEKGKCKPRVKGSLKKNIDVINIATQINEKGRWKRKAPNQHNIDIAIQINENG